MGWRGRNWYGPWPGRGPFSHLPPWQRPGWLYGPGSCWSLYGAQYPPLMQQQWPTAPEQLDDLEAYKKEVETELAEVNKEIARLKEEVKSKKEKE